MIKKDNPQKPSLTNAQTDSETGNEGLSKAQERDKHNKAMKALLDKNLITEEEYRKRVKD